MPLAPPSEVAAITVTAAITVNAAMGRIREIRRVAAAQHAIDESAAEGALPPSAQPNQLALNRHAARRPHQRASKSYFPLSERVLQLFGSRADDFDCSSQLRVLIAEKD